MTPSATHPMVGKHAHHQLLEAAAYADPVRMCAGLLTAHFSIPIIELKSVFNGRRLRSLKLRTPTCSARLRRLGSLKVGPILYFPIPFCHKLTFT